MDDLTIDRRGLMAMLERCLDIGDRLQLDIACIRIAEALDYLHATMSEDEQPGQHASIPQIAQPPAIRPKRQMSAL